MCAMSKREDHSPKSMQGRSGGQQRGGPKPRRPDGPGGGSRGRGNTHGGDKSRWPPACRYEEGYFRKDGHLKVSLLTTDAEQYADSFFRGRLTSAQLRRFYNEVKALEARIEAGGFEANAPLVKMLRSKVGYACPQQGNQKIPESFATFLWEHIEHIRSKQDFEDFCLMFEAVVGFFYGKGG